MRPLLILMAVLCLSPPADAKDKVVWFSYEDATRCVWARSWITLESGRQIGVLWMFDHARPHRDRPGEPVMTLPVTVQARVPFQISDRSLEVQADGRWYRSSAWDRTEPTAVVADSLGKNVLFFVPAVNPRTITAMRFTAGGDTMPMTRFNEPR